jgi:basic amino acid/polyamine antiporter, APA family
VSAERGTGRAPPVREPGEHPRDRLARTLGLTDLIMLVVSSVIGVGIFLTPGRIAELLPSPPLILAAWLVGGLLSLAGALANAELGAMYPRAGGDYVYLREAYHPVAGFLVGWLTFFVIYAGTVATLALGFAQGLGAFVSLADAETGLVAVGVTVLLSAVSYVGVRPGTVVNNVTAAAKIVALLVFALSAPFLLTAGSAAPGALPAPARASPAAFGLALSPVLFTYLGWNAPVYVASEIRRPARNLPASLFLGLAICTVVYLAVNAVYLRALPLSRLRGEINVGEAAALALLGPRAGVLVSGFILLSILGTLNATILVGPRIAYAMALDGLFFRGVERVHPTYRTPHRAIVVQGAIAVGLVALLRSFPSVLDYTTFAIVLATIADTAALYTLRRRRPAAPRPYRAWGYPLVPAVYLVASTGVAVALAWGRPWECALALGVAAGGLPFYWTFRAQARARSGR